MNIPWPFSTKALLASPIRPAAVKRNVTGVSLINEKFAQYLLLLTIKEGICRMPVGASNVDALEPFRGLIFTAGYTMMKAFEDKVEDIARMQKVEANY